MGPMQGPFRKAVPEISGSFEGTSGDDPSFRTLLQRVAVALPVCVLLVTLAYLFVDRPVAFFVHDHHLNRFTVLASAIVFLAAVRLAFGPRSPVC